MAGVALGPSGKWIDAIDPDKGVGDAARHSLEARLPPVIHHLPLAAYHAQQDVEHVHRLRVSTRRAVAALKLYRDWLPPKRSKWLRKQLKKIRKTAGTARDLDVLAQRLEREYGDHVGPILSKIVVERTRIQPDIIGLAERMRKGDRFVRKTAKLIGRIEAADGSSESGRTTSFKEWAQNQLAQFVEDFFAAQPAAEADMAELHKFRIRAKALRYAIELLVRAFPPEVKKTHYRAIEELQDKLGRINDHVNARDQLRAWSVDAQDAEARALFCEVADHEVVSLTDELGAFREWWTPERAKELSERLAGQGVHPRQ